MGLVITKKNEDEIIREKKREFRELKKKYLLNLLRKKGIDVNEFTNSKLFNNPKCDYFVEHLYGKIHGYDYDITSRRIETNGYLGFEMYEVALPNGHIMDIKKINIKYEDGILVVSDEVVSYKYKTNECSQIIVNDEILHYTLKILTDEEKKASLKELHSDLESRKNRNTISQIGSIDFAKTFHVR